MNSKDVVQLHIRHLTSVVEKYEQDRGPDGSISVARSIGLLARIENLIKSVVGHESAYTESLNGILSSGWDIDHRVEVAVELARTLKEELEDGALTSVASAIRGQIFEDLIGQAQQLLDNGYKDAAAVIAGISLETHLRLLCIENNVDLFVKKKDGTCRKKGGSEMNDGLLGELNHFTSDHRMNQGWLNIRNDAAHGHREKYTNEQVSLMVAGVKSFIERYPI